MSLSQKIKTIFHFLRTRNTTTDPENPDQSEQPQSKDNQGNTYGSLSEVAVPQPIDTNPSHGPSLEGRLPKLQKDGWCWLYGFWKAEICKISPEMKMNYSASPNLNECLRSKCFFALFQIPSSILGHFQRVQELWKELIELLGYSMSRDAT